MGKIRRNFYRVFIALLMIGAFVNTDKQFEMKAAEVTPTRTGTKSNTSTSTGFILTENGFGKLKEGAKVTVVKNNPVAGLYDSASYSKEMDEMEGEVVICGELKLKGKTIGSFKAGEDGVIYHIQFNTPLVKIKVNGKVYTIGDSFRALSKERGVSVDDYGSAVVNGITVYEENGKISAFNLGSPW